MTSTDVLENTNGDREMEYTLEQIIQKIELDIKHHEASKNLFQPRSEEWSFHLGWLDALTAYRWKLQLLLEEQD